MPLLWHPYNLFQSGWATGGRSFTLFFWHFLVTFPFSEKIAIVLSLFDDVFCLSPFASPHLRLLQTLPQRASSTMAKFWSSRPPASNTHVERGPPPPLLPSPSVPCPSFPFPCPTLTSHFRQLAPWGGGRASPRHVKNDEWTRKQRPKFQKYLAFHLCGRSGSHKSLIHWSVSFLVNPFPPWSWGCGHFGAFCTVSARQLFMCHANMCTVRIPPRDSYSNTREARDCFLLKIPPCTQTCVIPGCWDVSWAFLPNTIRRNHSPIYRCVMRIYAWELLLYPPLPLFKMP